MGLLSVLNHMIAPYLNKYLLIIIATALITVAQMTLMDIPYSLLTFLYLFVTQALAPVFFAGIVLIILWYTGRSMSPRTVFFTYLIIWALNIAAGFYIILTDMYDAYLITKIIST